MVRVAKGDGITVFGEPKPRFVKGSRPYIEQFGQQIGSKYFAMGLSLQQARERFIGELKAERDSLKRQIKAAAQSKGKK